MQCTVANGLVVVLEGAPAPNVLLSSWLPYLDRVASLTVLGISNQKLSRGSDSIFGFH